MRQIKLGIIDPDEQDRKLFSSFFLSKATLDCSISFRSIKPLWNHPSMLDKLDYVLLAYDEVYYTQEIFFHTLKQIKSAFPRLAVIIFTDYKKESFVHQCFNFGADGYLLKTTPKNNIETIFIDAFQKGAIVSPAIAKMLIVKLASKELPNIIGENQLSTKQLQIVDLLKQGKSYNDIADILGVSVYGIQYHIKKIYTRFEVNNKTALLNKFYLQSE